MVDDEYCVGWAGETKKFTGHILFIEEDHYIYPNAYWNLQLLIGLKSLICLWCHAANLAPSDVNYKGEAYLAPSDVNYKGQGWDTLIAEKIGNVGYAFNRTVWKKIHSREKEYCSFDAYNWDITLWATVYPSFQAPVYTIRGRRTNAAPFGKCGLHQGQGKSSPCIDNGETNILLDEIDKILNIKPNWSVHIFKKQTGYQAGLGWGSWGDERDQEICLSYIIILSKHHDIFKIGRASC